MVAVYTPPLVAPPADQEVHRHEHDFEEQEEHEQVEAEERPDHARLEQQHPGQVRLVVVVRVDAEQRQREQHGGEHDEEQRDAVDAEMPRDPPRLDPCVLRHELVAGFAGVERGEQPHAHRPGRSPRRGGRSAWRCRAACRHQATSTAPTAGTAISVVRIGKETVDSSIRGAPGRRRTRRARARHRCRARRRRRGRSRSRRGATTRCDLDDAADPLTAPSMRFWSAHAMPSNASRPGPPTNSRRCCRSTTRWRGSRARSASPACAGRPARRRRCRSAHRRSRRRAAGTCCRPPTCR